MRPFSEREALDHVRTGRRIGRRAEGMACEHPYLKSEPSGYLAWHEWAEKRSRRYEQEQCPDCGLWVIWRRKVAERL